MVITRAAKGYSAYLIDAAQLQSLSKTVTDIESYAAKEKQARDFVTNLKAHIVTAKTNGWNSGGMNQVFADFLQMLALTKVSSTDIASMNTVISTIQKFMDSAATYPSAAANARKVGTALADTLNTVTPEMLYAAMVN